jgi:hypothetical protein
MNTKVLENFITFLTRGRAQNFDFELRSYDRLKLSDNSRYGFFLFCIILSFLGLFFNVHLIHAHAYAISWHKLVLYVPHQKKSLPNI